MRLAGTVVVLVSVALLPSAARAAPASEIYSVWGVEVAFSSTQGTFTGKASGSTGDTGVWKTVVVHGPLSSLPAPITDGGFELATVGPGLGTEYAKGTFSGGSVDVLDRGDGCHNQKFSVKGTLGDVVTSTSSGGSGFVDVVLTHYRKSIWGYCATYSATVAGYVSFTY